MLYIEKDQNVPLPKKFHAANNVCAILYDQLTEVLKDELYYPLTTTSFDLSNKDLKLREALIKRRVHAFDFFRTSKAFQYGSSILVNKG